MKSIRKDQSGAVCAGMEQQQQQQAYLSPHHKVRHSVSLKITQRKEGVLMARAATFQSSQKDKKTKKAEFSKNQHLVYQEGAKQ